MSASVDADQRYQVELPEFEGPLDLLLHLVRRHELDILDIPISFVTEKYLEYLEVMQAVNLDVAGEYLLMAATLAHIKSKELLPRHEDEVEDEDGEEGGDPREELIRRLLEYQRYKDAAEHLGERPALGRSVFQRGAEPEKLDQEERPLAEVGIFELVAALNEVVKRSKLKLSYEVMVERISIGERVNQIVDLLSAAERVSFIDCFQLDEEKSAAQLRHEVVVTFLAVLEMAKLKMLRILQRGPGEAIYLSRTDALGSVEITETYA